MNFKSMRAHLKGFFASASPEAGQETNGRNVRPAPGAHSNGSPRSAATAPEQARPVPFRPLPAEKKAYLLQRFQVWLDQQPDWTENFDARGETGTAGPVTEHRTDLYALVAEFVALKNEIKIESRQFKNAFEHFQKNYELFERAHETLALDPGPQPAGEARPLLIKALILEILEIRDRLEDGLATLRKLKPKMLRAKFRKKAPVLKSAAEGQRMILQRLDKMLQSYGVAPIAAVGRRFDPHLMRAVDAAENPEVEHGVVLGEIRKGFMMQEAVLRFSEVVVNRHPAANEEGAA